MTEQATKNKKPISKGINENKAYFENRIGIQKSYDLGIRTIDIQGRLVQLYYLTGLCDSAYIIQLLKELVKLGDQEKKTTFNVKNMIQDHLVHQQIQPVKTLDESVDNLLSGLIVIFVDGEEEALVVDVRSYPGRQPQEPDTEKVVRGARDGYVENIVMNTALTRRRIRDERLRYEMLQVGERSKTDVCIAYIKDVADPRLVGAIRRELGKINIDGIPMSDKTIEEFLVNQGWNPFPLVRYTERPDVASSHLLEGHVLIFVDTSPSVIITPTTFFHHVQHAEEYRQTPVVGAYLRWVRFLGMLASILLPPLWFLYVLMPELLPPGLDFIGPNDTSNVPLLLQLIFADFGIDVLRMAAIHTPTPLSTAMGLIAAVLIGQIAIDVGLFLPEVILYVAVAAIGTFATPSYEMSIANKMIRLLLIFLVYFFGVPGLVIGLTVIILWLTKVKVFNTPYLWPFIPFNPKAFMQIAVRISVPLTTSRPSIVHPQNNKKQS